MLKIYEGTLEKFTYDADGPEVSERLITTSSFIGKINKIQKEFLHYVGKGNSVNLPDGCTNTAFMFRIVNYQKASNSLLT